MDKKLENILREFDEVAVAFSGGLDSSYLLHVASLACSRVTAYMVKTEFQPEFELADAKSLAAALGVELRVITMSALAGEGISDNSEDRCYRCKLANFTEIKEAARSDGYEVVCDGTNASDDAADRPGMRALQELGVISPLRLAGLGKSEIRAFAREAGLETANKPSYACLATRVPSGVRIEKWMLELTERSENFLRELGMRDFRVRLLPDGGGFAARIEVASSDVMRLLDNRQRILDELGGAYSKVLLDLEVRDE